MNTVAIIGATGTIGSAVTRRLVRNRRPVLLLGRDEQKLSALSAEVQQPYAVIDLRNSQSLEAALKNKVSETGGYDALVNCVGSLFLKPAHATSDDDFRTVLETNLFSAFATVRAAAQALRERGGSIVLFASAAAEIGIQNHEAIAAAKGGVIGLARSAAATYATHGIRVNVVSPGLIRTEMTRRIWENPIASSASVELHALRRFGEPEQVASLVAWLVDPENDWVTGQVIGVDGGLAHVIPKKRQ